MLIFLRRTLFCQKENFECVFFVQSVFACLANIERAQRNRGQGTQAQLPLRRPSDLKLITFKHYSSNQWSSWKLSKQQYDPQQTLLSINILIFLFRRWIYPHFSLHLVNSQNTTIDINQEKRNDLISFNISYSFGEASQPHLWLVVTDYGMNSSWAALRRTEVHQCIGHTENCFFCTGISSLKNCWDIWIGWFVEQSFNNPIIMGL